MVNVLALIRLSLSQQQKCLCFCCVGPANTQVLHLRKNQNVLQLAYEQRYLPEQALSFAQMASSQKPQGALSC